MHNGVFGSKIGSRAGFNVNSYTSCFVIIILIACSLFSLPSKAEGAMQPDSSHENTNSFSIEYLEDSTSSLILEQVQTKEVSQDFKQNSSSFLATGSSRSTLWVRLKAEYSNAANEGLFISVNNAIVENVILYVPCVNEGIKSYSVLKSGWHHKGDTDDEDFLYPVFKLPQNIDRGQFIYIRIQSVYSHNYDIRVLKGDEFNAMRQKTLLFVALLLGILLTMVLLNSVIYLVLKEKSYLYYVIYIILMFIFQTVLLGVPRVFGGEFYSFLIVNTSAVPSLTMIALTVLVRSFLETSRNAPKHDFALKLLTVAGALYILPMFFGWKHESNIVSNLLVYVLDIVILSAAVICIRKGIRQAKIFLLAWAMLIVGGVVFFMRGWGVLPNTFLTQQFPLIAAAAEAVLIFIALIDRARILMYEKQKAIEMLVQAKEGKRAAEISFLQAQIKPHFLYNSLSVIAALTIKDPPRAKKLLYNLSDYLRGSFNFENINGMAMLREELATVRAYLAIEKERFRDKLRVEYDIDEAVKISIPLLTIQPLIENALRHGIFKKPEGGAVQISIKNLNDFVLIKVRDDGVGMSKERLSEVLDEGIKASGVGLKNINRRLKFHYGNGLEIESREGIGTKVTIRIPRTP